MAQVYAVSIRINDQLHSFNCSADQTLLSAAEAADLALPSSHRSGQR
jgi:hypothetical protein